MSAILVVDDHADTANLMARLLRREGHIAYDVPSGEEALAVLSSVCFDLIILDYMMPDMSGGDVLNALRSSPQSRMRDQPVAMYSADPGVTQRGLDAQEFIRKGTPWKDVYARLSPYLAARNPPT